MRIPKAVIPKFSGVKTDLLTDADNSDLRKAIRDAVPAAVEQTKNLAEYFRASNERETCKRIFDYLKKNVKYKADDWQQVVQMPSAIMRKGAIADCKSMSLFTAAILQNLGIPWHFVLASYTDSAIPGHIYVVTDSGCIIDVVWGKFDSEKKANHRYKMKVSYLAGITGPMIAGTGKSGGYCGIGATEGAVEWAKRNQVWDKYSILKQAQIRALSAMPLSAGARLILKQLIESNAGGLASMLWEMRLEAGKNQAGWNAMRSIELRWFENGGNPAELYEMIDKGKTKRPKGKKFAQLIKLQKSGQNISAKTWLTGIVSALFGKRYDEASGKITGYGITGDPGTIATILTSAAFWQPILAATITAVSAAIVTKISANVEPSADETTGGGGETPGGGTPGGTPGGAEAPKNKTTLYIVGGVAALAALWYFTKKKK
jgi:hypothetical protein